MSDPFREVAAMASLTYLAISHGCSSPPKDEAMLATFRAERPRFEELREKMCKLPEPLDLRGPSNLAPAQIPASEQEWYKETLAAMKAENAVVLPDPCRLWIQVWSVGAAMSSSATKAYRFGPPLLDEVVNLDSLDDLEPSSTAWAIIYQRKIEGDWWLEHNHFR